MKTILCVIGLAAVALCLAAAQPGEAPLGLPPVPIPADNPQTLEKIALGDKLFHDKRFSSTGKVACAECHAREKAFTDGPRSVSVGIEQLTGTRNAPTVINAAYLETQFWDGRSPSLEDQALHPFTNPVEHGLENHDPILKIVRSDPEYVDAFGKVFGKSGDAVTMDEVTKAIASFERTIVAGNSRFDRWYFGGETDALSEAEQRGFDLFINQGRCVSCHLIEQTQALFTDNRFHNIGVGINDIQDDVGPLVDAFLEADASLSEVDVKVLTDTRTSELGRFAISHDFDGLGAFRTPTLRNIAVTAPYMHDGSLETLEETIMHYNNGGVSDTSVPVNDFLSGGIRPLNLTDEQMLDLTAFMESLTSPEFIDLVEADPFK